jgi:energy-converting hydrogenase Eha subunit A
MMGKFYRLKVGIKLFVHIDAKFMETKRILLHVIFTFGIALITGIIVTLLWNLMIEKAGPIVDWKTSFMFAAMFGLVIPIVQRLNKNK